MRPILRGPSPIAIDYSNYTEAKPDLVARLGPFCSFCERPVTTQLAVEHIQPKGLACYAHLIGRWSNFLLACVNCNSTKKDKDLQPQNAYLPDRDNTFFAYIYLPNGVIEASPVLSPPQAATAKETLKLLGLDKPVVNTLDENGTLVALDRVSQRMEAWLAATEAKNDIDVSPGNAELKKYVVKLAIKTGFFSVWMTVFNGDANMRLALINAFKGTSTSGCFDPATSDPISPSPNADALLDGGKL